MLFQGYPLAALARLYNHVGQLFYFGCFSNVVEDGEGFQILGHTARRGRSFWIYGVIQAEYLEGETKKKKDRLRQLPLMSKLLSAPLPPTAPERTPLKAARRFLDFSGFLCFSTSIWCSQYAWTSYGFVHPVLNLKAGAYLESASEVLPFESTGTLYFWVQRKWKGFYPFLQVAICCLEDFGFTSDQREKRPLQSIGTSLLLPSGYVN